MKLLVSLVAAILVTSSVANADGLFGDDGLIGGFVGEVFDSLEHEVLTPLAQGAAVAAGGTVGVTVGSLIGAPNLGGVVGVMVGEAVNDAAAGN